MQLEHYKTIFILLFDAIARMHDSMRTMDLNMRLFNIHYQRSQIYFTDFLDQVRLISPS